MSTLKEIANVLDASVVKYIEKVVKKLNADKDKMMKIWIKHKKKEFSCSEEDEELPSLASPKKEEEPKKEKPKKETAKEVPKETSKETAKEKTKTVEKKSSDSLCKYIYKRGDKNGEQCTSKVKNTDFCSKHKKSASKDETKESKEKKVTPDILGKTTSLVLRYNKEIDRFWHPETELVFESKDDKTAIGKKVGNKVKDLTDEDMELCKQKCFKFRNTKKSSEVSKSKSVLDDDSDDDSDDDDKKETKETKKSVVKLPSKEEDDEDDEDEDINEITEKTKNINISTTSVIKSALGLDDDKDDSDSDLSSEDEE